MQQAAQLNGTDKDLAAVAEAMAQNLPKTPGTGKGAAAAKRAAKAPSKPVVSKAEQLADAPMTEAERAKHVAGHAKAVRKPRATKPAATDVNAALGAALAKDTAERKAKTAEAKAALQPGAYINREKHTTIVISVGRKLVNHIPMDSAGLAVSKMSIDRFSAEYTYMADYDAAKAAAQYLASPVMKTPQAEAALQEVATGAKGKPLAKGTSVPLMSRGDAADAADALPAQPRVTKAGKAKAPSTGRAWDKSERKLAVGAAKLAGTVREGTFRYALMEHIIGVAKKGGTAGSCLGAEVMAGKPKLAKVDVEFALKAGYVKLA